MRNEKLEKYLLSYKHDSDFSSTLLSMEVFRDLRNPELIDKIKKKVEKRLKYRAAKEYNDLNIRDVKIKKEVSKEQYVNARIEEQNRIIDFNVQKANKKLYPKMFEKFQLFLDLIDCNKDK